MGHTAMTAPVYVVSQSDFQTWVTQHQTPATIIPTTTTSSTAGQLAALGQSIFSTSCAKCHGSAGQGGLGPTLIGQGNSLSKYTTAQGLFNFMSVNMPLDAPASLSHEQYIELLSFLLVQNNFLQSSAIFNESTLSSIPLK